MEDIQLIKYFEVDKTIPTIICQANHQNKDLDINFEESEK